MRAAWLLLLLTCVSLGRIGLNSALDVDQLPWPSGVTDERSEGWEGLATVSAPAQPWTLLIGNSGVNAAFDPTALGIPTRKQTRPFGLPTDVAYALAWNLQHTLRPEQRPSRVVWGLNRVSFMARRNLDPCLGYPRLTRPDRALDDTLDPCSVPAQRAVDRVQRRLLPFDRWFFQRDTTKDLVAQGLWSWFSGGAARQPIPEDLSGRIGAARWRNRARRAQRWRAQGTYRRGTVLPLHINAVKAVAQMTQETGIELVLVLMPEDRRSRERYHPVALANFRRMLRDHAPLIDLLDAVPDEEFYDLGHTNLQGRKRATRLLREAL